MSEEPEALGYRRLLALAWPIVLAQMATALTGVVDTAVMGRFGVDTDLAAVAIASVVFSFLYWGFGFLRMATTGLTAQSTDDPEETRAILIRALLTGASIGVLIVLTAPVWRLAMQAFEAEPEVVVRALGYLDARVLGAPAALMGFAVTGWLLGRGRTRELLTFQVAVNGLNAGLDALFVGVFDLGPSGIGAGTAIAEWSGLALGLWLVRDGLATAHGLWDRPRWTALFVANRDILVRTLALLFAFGWFVRAGNQLGTEEAAANQVLLQFIAVSAFVLDAFAFLAERETGVAIGRRDPAHLRRAAWRTSLLALVSGAGFVVVVLATGPTIIRAFVADPEVSAIAITYLPWCAMVPLLGVPAWQLDGLFLGATQGRSLRNAAVAATLLYILVDTLLRPWGMTGIWIAFLANYVGRAVMLAVGLPAMLRAAQPRPAP